MSATTSPRPGGEAGRRPAAAQGLDGVHAEPGLDGHRPAPPGAVRTLVALYLLIFLGEVVWTALIPMLPVYRAALHLDGLQTGTLLAAAGVAILAVSVPSGRLADRLGAKPPTVAAALVLTAAVFWHAPRRRLLVAGRRPRPVRRRVRRRLDRRPRVAA